MTVRPWGGAAFVLGNLLFMVNKLNEMSRLFLGRPMPDVISGQNPALILLGQVALFVGYVAYYQYYSRRVGRSGQNALRLFSGGGIVLTFGHVSYLSFLPHAVCFGSYRTRRYSVAGKVGSACGGPLTKEAAQRARTFMTETLQSPTSLPPALRVAVGEDRFGEHHGLGISTIDFKVSSQGSGGFFVLENTFHAMGGPARHLHYNQDEWFYAVEGEFLVEVGTERFRLNPGDSLLAPRKVPHVWAYVGDTRGRMLITFMPAGKMEAFFREVTKANAMPPQDPALWRAYGMELLGPPLAVE